MAYMHLSLEERYQSWADRKVGKSCWAISGALGRSKATVSRKWRSNQGLGNYRPDQAHWRARERVRCSGTRIRASARKWRLVMGLLRRDWYPE